MKNFLIVIFALIVPSLSFAGKIINSAPNLLEISRAEGSCNAKLYQETLRASGYDSSVVSFSLANAIYKCHRSGHLAQMIQANFNAGGSPAESREFAGNHYNTYGVRFSPTPIGFLQEINERKCLTHELHQDIQNAIDLLNKKNNQTQNRPVITA